MLNKQGPNKIDWTDYTWNPISGCLHGCPYCYMLRMEKRFKGTMDPAFHEKRLLDPLKLKKASKIFTGSSGDMWGEWVERDWINEVISYCLMADQHTYQFLTKNPKRYAEFRALSNCWYGTTDDGTFSTVKNIKRLLESVPENRIRFASFEPLLHQIQQPLDGLDWIIIGANSNRDAIKPPNKWADELIREARLLKIPVWVKDNYKYHSTIKEVPDGV